MVFNIYIYVIYGYLFKKYPKNTTIIFALKVILVF